LKWLAIWISELAATIWISGLAQAASAPHTAGQIRPSSRELAPIHDKTLFGERLAVYSG
jgi:hypothetical protein